MIRVAIIDDDALIRESLKILLDGKENITITHQGENGRDALRIHEAGVDVMLLDIRMPGMDGLEALSRMKEQKVLILTTFHEDEGIIKAINLGAKGYLLKSASPKSIQHAILEIASGRSVFDEVAMEILRRGVPEQKHSLAEQLTTREEEIVQKIAEGLSNKEIAEALFISEGTVKNYISSVLGKTGLEHRTQLAIWRLKGKL